MIAAEPSPRTLRALQRNIATNGVGTRVAIEATAVGAETGEVEFHDSDHSAGSHVLSAGTMQAERLGRVTVPMTTLDRIVEARGLSRLDLVKVDVEGFESEVLDGAAGTISLFRPVFVLEFNAWTIMCNRNQNPRQVLEDWLGRFPVVHAIRGAEPPERITPDAALGFLHDHLVQRHCMDDLVLGFDEGWAARWRPPPGARRRR